MDGVLVDSEPIHEKAQHIVCRQYDLDVPKSVSPKFKGWTEDRVYEYIATNFGTGSTTVEHLIEAKHAAYANLSDELQLVPGALDLVQFVHHAGLPLGLVTSATKADQERAFANFNLSPYFSSVVTFEDVDHPKPAPEPFLTGAAQLEVPVKECLVIEDSGYGILGALRAGCIVFGIATTFPVKILQEAGAHAVFQSMREIELHIKALLSSNT